MTPQKLLSQERARLAVDGARFQSLRVLQSPPKLRGIPFFEPLNTGFIWPPDWLDRTITSRPVSIEALIEIGCDPDSFQSEEIPDLDGDYGVALEALMQIGLLRLEEAIEPLAATFCKSWDGSSIFSQIRFEIVAVSLGMMGEKIIEPMVAIIEKRRKVAGKAVFRYWSGAAAFAALKNLVTFHPSYRDHVLEIAIRTLEQHREQPRVYNDLIISTIVEINGIEAMDLIREAYAAGSTDDDSSSPISRIEADLGLN